MVANASFRYHANAHALSGQIERPVRRMIEMQAGTTLPATGGNSNSRVENFRVDRVLSFRAAYSHVSGSERVENSKTIHTTLVTAAVEGLNILDMATADRIVARLTSLDDAEQPEGHIIAVGSHFEGLRLLGFDVKVTLRHDLLINSKTFADLQRSVKSDAKTGQIAILDDEVALFSLVKEIETDLAKVRGGRDRRARDPDSAPWRGCVGGSIRRAGNPDADHAAGQVGVGNRGPSGRRPGRGGEPR